MNTGWLPDPENHPLWPGILALLERAARRGECSAYDEDDLVWIAIDGSQIVGVASTRPLSADTAELMHVAGTRIREWAEPMERQICDWARRNGASRIVAAGRRGWKPIVGPLGWRVTGEGNQVQYEKDL